MDVWTRWRTVQPDIVGGLVVGEGPPTRPLLEDLVRGPVFQRDQTSDIHSLYVLLTYDNYGRGAPYLS